MIAWLHEGSADKRAKVIKFVRTASRGPWWTRMQPGRPPDWPKDVVHVSRTRYRLQPNLTALSVAHAPSPGSVPIRVGASEKEIAAVADKLMHENILEGLPSIASLFKARTSRHGKPEAAADNVARQGHQARGAFARGDAEDALYQLGSAVQSVGAAAAATADITGKAKGGPILKVADQLTDMLSQLAMRLPEAREIVADLLEKLQRNVLTPAGGQKRKPSGPVPIGQMKRRKRGLVAVNTAAKAEVERRRRKERSGAA